MNQVASGDYEFAQMMQRSGFESYSGFDPEVPVWCVSKGDAPAMHRFYDSAPMSPSGRYLAYTEFPYEDRLPSPGDEAFAVVVDLQTGEEVYRSATAAWDSQLGCQIQWGAEDTVLLFNRMNSDTWQPYGVSVDIFTKSERALEGTIYAVSPDGDLALSPDLRQIFLVQPGYGVIVPQEQLTEPTEISATDGLFVTDLTTGTARLMLSFEQICDALPDTFSAYREKEGGFYGFHPKWSPDGQKIMFLIRWRSPDMRKGQSKNWIITMNRSGGDLKVALTAERWVGGHHPNWCPDSETIVMNLAFRNPKAPLPKLMRFSERVLRKLKITWHSNAYYLRFATFRYDGSDLQVVAPSHLGSGHPTWHGDLESILTDAYPNEQVTEMDGTVPLRLVEIPTDTSRTLVRIRTKPRFTGAHSEWRVDPHPAWSRDMEYVIFNASPNGTRQVFLMDMSSLQAPSKRQASI